MHEQQITISNTSSPIHTHTKYYKNYMNWTNCQKNENNTNNTLSNNYITDKHNNYNYKITTYNTFYVKSIEQAITVGLHLLIMACFEIYFYFYFIIDIERQLFLNKVSDYTNSITMLYTQYLTPTNIAIIKILIPEKQINEFVLVLYENYMSALQNQKQLYTSLLNQAILFVIFIASCLCFVTIIGVYNYRKHINWKWVLLENVNMFITLGAFEYFFYTKIILNYSPITDAELKYMFIKKITEPFLITDSQYS